jgi:hypothetical protein
MVENASHRFLILDSHRPFGAALVPLSFCLFVFFLGPASILLLLLLLFFFSPTAFLSGLV